MSKKDQFDHVTVRRRQERARHAWLLRYACDMKLREVGAEIGVSIEMARQLVEMEQRRQDLWLRCDPHEFYL